MIPRRADCTIWATVVVSWSWEGARQFPSVYRFCEECADKICAWLEGGMEADCPPPENLVVDDARHLKHVECYTALEARE